MLLRQLSSGLLAISLTIFEPDQCRVEHSGSYSPVSQLLQIDTAGCMEVVRERKAQPPALFQPGSQNTQQVTHTANRK